MTDGSGQWERELIANLASAALKEQRRARRWGIFFKLLTFAYVTVIIVLAVDWKSLGETTGKHTRGMTVIDQRTLIDRPDPNCDRLISVDGDAAWAVVLEAIAHFSI